MFRIGVVKKGCAESEEYALLNPRPLTQATGFRLQAAKQFVQGFYLKDVSARRPLPLKTRFRIRIANAVKGSV
jgi:hypothetical protein